MVEIPTWLFVLGVVCVGLVAVLLTALLVGSIVCWLCEPDEDWHQ